MKKCSLMIGMTLLLMIFAKESYSQIINKYIRKGNKLYENQDFTDAEAEYKKALNKDSKSPTGLFNLGNSLYEQKRYQDAMEQYTNSAKNTANPLHQSAADYNIGNTFMSGKKWEDAIKSYKQSLLKNPGDSEARYNLAYAQEMLKKQQNSGGGGENNKQQNKNQQNKQNQQQQNKDQQNKQNQDQNKEQQQPRPEPGDINKQRADQLLSAAEQAEQKLQDKKDKKQKGQPVYGGKDW
ncbi:MAG: tetratricopeptide repeat protein [Chitinophagaceae bacterium]|nr:MAG: tetratricopeptide repeat protein [Chitinophagaceae bacterium]